MKQIRASTSLKTIQKLNLSWCNWEIKANCEELANLLANADSLNDVGLKYQMDDEGNEKTIDSSIDVKAIEDKIVVTRGEEEICSADRNSSHHMCIYC